jgi:hypothetical protein
MRKPSCWRLNPDAALQYAVETMARAEARPVSQMLFVLVREAVNNRRSADRQVHALAGAIRSIADRAPPGTAATSD